MPTPVSSMKTTNAPPASRDVTSFTCTCQPSSLRGLSIWNYTSAYNALFLLCLFQSILPHSPKWTRLQPTHCLETSASVATPTTMDLSNHEMSCKGHVTRVPMNAAHSRDTALPATSASVATHRSSSGQISSGAKNRCTCASSTLSMSLYSHSGA